MEVLSPLVHFNQPISAAVLAVGALLVALVAVVLRSWNHALGCSPNRDDLETPFLPGHPVIGNLLAVGKHMDALNEMWIHMGRERKDPKKHLCITVPGHRIIDCSKPEYLEYIQKTNFQNYVKGATFSDNMKQVLGTGIFAVDGDLWHSQRKATSRIFTGNNFRGIINRSLDSNLERFLTIVRRNADSGAEFALDSLFFRLTLNSFGEMAFGADVGGLNLDSDKPIPFAESFDFAQTVLDRRFNDPFWKIKEKFNGVGAQMVEAVKILDDFSYGIIDQRAREGLGNITASNKKDTDLDLLSLYMAMRDENGQPMNRKALRDAVLNLIIAGRDTTAQSLSWAFFHLLSNPELLAKLRAEADEVGAVDYDTSKSLIFTTATFLEATRLHPAVSRNGWEALGDDQIPHGGPSIKKGDCVFWSDWIMARDTSIWGSNASVFDPTRWIDEDGQLKRESQWKAHSFNGGARICLGRELAIFEGVTTIAALVKWFDFAFAPDYLSTVKWMETERTPRSQPSLTLPLLEPLRVVASRRKSDGA